MVERVRTGPDSRTPVQAFSEAVQATTMGTTSSSTAVICGPGSRDVAQTSDDQTERHDRARHDDRSPKTSVVGLIAATT
jgi:hypothetical protein